jgi:hypothetical protein
VNKIESGSNTVVVSLFFFILLLLAGLFLLRQYELTQEAEQEAARNYNNYLAKQDSVRILSSSFGSVLAEKSALKLKYDELSQDNKDLIDRLELANNKKPSVIIQTEVVYRDTGISVPTSTIIRDSTKQLVFKHQPKLPGSYQLNFRLVSQPVVLNFEQKIDLVTGLYTDPKTGRVYVRATTDFPGISFSDLQALEMIDDSATRQALKKARKKFGVGINFGWSIAAGRSGYIMGPGITVGLTYTPTFLQFGR